ncbi:MAG TPA: hypothetical protein VIG46_09505 [Candidatus Baltobacteraceae bacterium]|jgi:hypothetical protein
MSLRAFAFLAVVGLVACSGGSTAPVPGGGPTSMPAPQPTGANATLTIAIPLPAAPGSSDRHPAYVSPSTTTLRVQVNTVNGVAPPAWVPADISTPLVVGGNCSVSGGTKTCTVPVAAPAGVVNYTFTAGDGTNALSRLTTDETMVQGTVNAVSVTLRGIVKTVAVSGATLVANAPPSGNSEILSVSASDADGNTIVSPGNYDSPIGLTLGDATASTALTVNGGGPGTTAVVNAPSDVVRLSYAGRATNPFAIAASGSVITGGGTIATSVDDVTFAGTTLDDAAHGGLNTDPNWGMQTLFFTQASGTQGFTAAELGWTNAPYNQLFDVALSSGADSCSGIASISAGPATGFTVTALGAGICSGQVTEHGTGYPLTGHPVPTPGQPTQDGHFWISVTTSSFGVSRAR